MISTNQNLSHLGRPIYFERFEFENFSVFIAKILMMHETAKFIPELNAGLLRYLAEIYSANQQHVKLQKPLDIFHPRLLR